MSQFDIQKPSGRLAGALFEAKRDRELDPVAPHGNDAREGQKRAGHLAGDRRPPCVSAVSGKANNPATATIAPMFRMFCTAAVAILAASDETMCVCAHGRRVSSSKGIRSSAPNNF